MTVKYSGEGILDNTDETKVMSFDVSGVTTNTTRTLTMPDRNVTIGDAGDLTGNLPAIDGSSLTNLPAAGKLIGYQYSTDTTNRSGTAGSEVATGLTFSYTPSATSSRLLISMFVPCTTYDASTSAVRVKWRVRTGTGTGGTELTASSFGDYENEVNVAQFDAAQTFTFIHHPNTTSAQSYNLTVEDLSGTATWKCSGIDNTGVTTISILEIEG